MLGPSLIRISGGDFTPDRTRAASSSRSQVAARAASATARVACGRPSMRVRWRSPLSVAIVTHFVLGRSRAGRERLLSPTRFPSLRAWVQWSSVRSVTSAVCPA